VRRDQTYKTASIAGASDLTILAPIKKGLVPALDAVTYKTRVKRVLRLLHLGRTTSHEYEMGRVLSDAVERVGKIHSIRIAVLEPEDKVLLVVTFDGAWESYIRVIWQKVSRLLDLIFCNTEGYKLGWESSYDEWCAWLRSAQAETLFLYSQPSLTNTDTHYLKGIERIYRREEKLQDANYSAASYSAPSAEETAHYMWSRGFDVQNRPYGQVRPYVIEGPAFRQGLRTLLGLYRLSDVYMPTVGDGGVLHRACKELLVEFEQMVADEKFSFGVSIAEKNYPDAMQWFSKKLDYQRTVPMLPLSQDSLIDALDVQGGIVKPYEHVTDGCLLMVSFQSPKSMADFLKSFIKVITNIEKQQQLKVSQIAKNIGLTVEGLRFSGWTDAEISELPEEFAQGMDKRQSVLGDLYMNHPRRWRLPTLNWEEGGEAKDDFHRNSTRQIQLSSVHAVLQLRLCSDGSVKEAKNALLGELQTIIGYDKNTKTSCYGVTPLTLQWMHRLKDDKSKPIEHFGFREAETNPTLEDDSASTEFNNQVHLGEVLYGYPNAADHDIPANGAKSARIMSFLQNGSFLVIRKLRQDVRALNNALNQATSEEREKSLILAKMMGRWPAGATNSENSLIENLPVGIEDIGNTNNFNFNADSQGSGCPFHAHIRRANPRGKNTSADGIDPSVGRRNPRIVRRGMSYGPRYDPNDKTSADQERGLIFMAYNASIGEQFEVIQRWISGGNSTDAYSGQSDPILGVAEPGRPRYFQFAHDGKVKRVYLDGSDTVHGDIQPLVLLEWGTYLFTPSVKALKSLAERAEKTQSLPTMIGLPTVIEWSVEKGEKIIADLRSCEHRSSTSEAMLAWKAVIEDPDSATEFKAASVWAAIRKNHGGVLKTPFGVLVASQELADQVLLDKDRNLTAQAYLPRMQNSFGQLYLGMDEGRTDQAYEKESAVANHAVLSLARDQKAFEEIIHQAAIEVQKRIDELVQDAKNSAKVSNESNWQTTIDIRDSIEKLISHFCEQWFGLSEEGGYFVKGGFDWKNPVDMSQPRYPGNFMAPSRYVFQPHPSDTVRDIASIHGKTLLNAMTAYLKEYGEGKQKDRPLVMSICKRGEELNDEGYAARTILGLMMGFVPTTDGLIRRIASEWLREGVFWKLRSQLMGQADGDWNKSNFAKLFESHFWQTFLLRAAPELLWRTAKRDHVVGKDHHSVAVSEGDMIVVGQISATHEGLENSSQASYVYAFGHSKNYSGSSKPTHACPGRDAATAVMMGFFKGLLTSKHAFLPGPSSLTLTIEGALSKEDFKHSNKEFFQYLSYQNFQSATEESSGPPIQLFAIGDSWVYQDISIGFHNLCSQLKRLGFDFLGSSDDFTGDSAKELFNFTGQKLSQLVTLESRIVKRFKLIREQEIDVKAIIFSAGGNDISAHDKKKPIDYKTAKLYSLLKQKPNGLADSFIDVDIKKSGFFVDLKKNYIAIFKILLLKTDLPILIHGYDFPIPDGRGVTKFGIPLAIGPWLQGVFLEKKISEDLGRQIMQKLIVNLNEWIHEIITDTQHFSQAEMKRLHLLKFYGVIEKQAGYSLPPDVGYKRYWANELHATDDGYNIFAQLIIDKLVEIGVLQQLVDLS
jgi:deferrochelatase/peroxidase EfeB